MAYPIWGSPKPQFFDSSGSPLASGTLDIYVVSTTTAKDYFTTADNADANTNAATAQITLDSRGEPSNELWGRDGENYKLLLKDSTGTTIYTVDDIRLPGHSRRTEVTFTTSDTTPSIAESNTFACNASTAVGITDFDDDNVGDTIYIQGGAVATAISQGANIDMANTDSMYLAPNDTITLHRFSDSWREVARMRYGNLRQAVTSNQSLIDTTLADIAALSGFDLMASHMYAVRGYLKVGSDGDTQDIKFALETDNAFQGSLWSYWNINEDATLSVSAGLVADSGVTTTAMTADLVNGKTHGIIIQGFVWTHATAATTVDFQAAQGTDAGTTTIYPGSWIAFEEMIAI